MNSNQITEKQQTGISFSICKNVLYYIIKDLIIRIKMKILKNHIIIITNVYKVNFSFITFNCNNNSGIACFNHNYISISNAEVSAISIDVFTYLIRICLFVTMPVTCVIIFGLCFVLNVIFFFNLNFKLVTGQKKYARGSFLLISWPAHRKISYFNFYRINWLH